MFISKDLRCLYCRRFQPNNSFGPGRNHSISGIVIRNSFLQKLAPQIESGSPCGRLEIRWPEFPSLQTGHLSPWPSNLLLISLFNRFTNDRSHVLSGCGVGIVSFASTGGSHGTLILEVTEGRSRLSVCQFLFALFALRILSLNAWKKASFKSHHGAFDSEISFDV